ncbi:MAG TPA: lactonase family protein [Candidatus Faecaligallichristensenella faecipullorum]|nr:lactonase family protein [Candidatus Faecaligallichristensenella faecipullorum]
MPSGYIGTYTGDASKGIYAFEIQNGRMKIELAAECENPSYLTLSPDGKNLYAVVETQSRSGQNGGAVRAYARDAAGGLRFLGEQLTLGKDPCHLSTDFEGRFLFCANYSEGTCSVFPIEEGGALGPMVKEIVHTGHGPNPARQERAHVHQCQLTPDGQALVLCDLGLDQVVFYDFKPGRGVGECIKRLSLPGGVGPRHAALAPGGALYVLSELESEVLVFDDWRKQEPRLVQRIPLLDSPNPEQTGAAIRLTPDGGQILATVRGADSLNLLDIEPDGRLKRVQRENSGGLWPRDAAFSPDGSLLLCANQMDDSVCLRRRREGRLLPVEEKAFVGNPCCILWA